MDPVSRILVERERSQPRLLPWVVLAVLLHAGAAAATYLVSTRSAARPVQLPSVSVKIVRPQAPSPRRQAPGPERRATAAPQPTKPPATAVPKPSAAPTAAAAKPETAGASADAMRAADAVATPAPTPPPAEPGGAGGGSGLSVGGTGGGATSGIPSDFHFTYYVERMLALIESRWYKPAVPAGTRARVGFVILKDGRLEGIRLEESSGMPSFDRAALRAIYAANPLPPLPPAYGKPSLTVHLSFAE
jgi:periplasmic protein TonB